MKKLLFFFASLALAQTPSGQLGTTTVAGLSGLSGVVHVAYVVLVTDGTSATDCTTGGGSTKVYCSYNGSTWSVFGGGVTVPGSNTQVIFNDSGNLGANSGFTFNKSTGNVAIGTSVPTGAPANSLAIAGSAYGEASNLFGLVHSAPAMIVFSHGFGTISANTCTSAFPVPFPGIQSGMPTTLGSPPTLGVGLQPIVTVPASDYIVLILCNYTSGNIAAGSGVNFTVTHN